MNLRIGISLHIIIILALGCRTASAQSIEQLRSMHLPLLTITTVGGEMPAADIAYPPVDSWGCSITNNDYVKGRMVMTLGDDTLYDSGEYLKDESGMKIKRRGNSTGAYLNQHPYKLKLTKKNDLLMRGDSRYDNKSWLLMSMYTWNVKMTNSESNVLNVAGLLVSKIVGKEWTPDFRFVNVVLNGEYQGMYYLMESVDRGDSRVDVSKAGFLIEDDPFWWNEDVCFSTGYRDERNAFTYKYPDSDDVNDSIQQVVSSYMTAIEREIYATGNSLEPLLDYDSFAKWILIHDILGTDDSVGANRYLYKYSLDDADRAETKLAMGPTWDYDSSFRGNLKWSRLHDYFYFPRLFQREDFRSVYRNLWDRVRPELLQRFKEGLDDVWNEYGDVFDENMKLHKMLFPGEGRNAFRYQLDELLTCLEERVAVLDDQMAAEFPSEIEGVFKENDLASVTDMQGRRYSVSSCNGLPRGIYVLQYRNGRTRKTVVK